MKLTIERSRRLTAMQRVAVVGRESFQASMRRATVAVDASDCATSVKLEIDGATATMSARGADADAADETEVEYEGEPILMGLNAVNFLDALNAVGSETVEIEFGENELKPCVLRDPTDPGFLVVCAAVRV